MKLTTYFIFDLKSAQQDLLNDVSLVKIHGEHQTT